MLKIIILLILSDLLGLAGQIFYKKKLNNINTKKYKNFLKTSLSSSKIWAGFSCIGVSIIIWLMALSMYDLNIVYSLGSINYIMTLGASKIFLGEKIDKSKIIGTILVCAGIVFVVMS